MSNNLYPQIQDDMKNAMRAKEVFLLGTIRLLIAAIKQREIDERITLNDNQILAIINKMIKQRNDSIKQYLQASRQESADKEAAEIEILKKYLPQALAEEEVADIIKEAFAKTNATLIKDMAKVMAYIKTKAEGRADMGKISSIVRSKLN
jgi:uncharacterized protein